MKITQAYKTLILGALLTTGSLHADTIVGSDVEVGMWQPKYSSANSTVKGESKSIFASATLEHPIPMLPNLKGAYSTVKSDKYEYTKLDATAYYEVLDNDLVSIDLGLGASQYMDGKFNGVDFKGTLPHLYVDAELSLPMISSTLYTDIKYMDYNDNTVTDAMAGLRYDFNLVAADLGVKAGYRVQSINTQDLGGQTFDIKTDGYFIGLHADF
jgi:outer membrane protein